MFQVFLIVHEIYLKKNYDLMDLILSCPDAQILLFEPDVFSGGGGVEGGGGESPNVQK